MDTIEETLKENIEEMLCYRFKVLELTPEIEDMSLEILNNIKTNLFNPLNNIKKMVEGDYFVNGSSFSGILPL